uniref:Uncharacterized protein n=1 Tax=Quercus lobata TaxID=97700 RepID=A0A7N2LNE7_QUELO
MNWVYLIFDLKFMLEEKSTEDFIGLELEGNVVGLGKVLSGDRIVELGLLIASLDDDDDDCNRGENIQISVIGDSSKLSRSLQELITGIEETTNTNCGLQLIAF